ncbi:splicing factor 3B subunit 4 [Sporothrix schenckii 1099-18]|uniref:Splicing factor 3B subunit 4 n=1 Tax=Sporothrix schenckii 1099-18 TaxID=1397361 RepID=A0A0F2M6C7_SPOSC|nr:splicing factor 3B subunit 4 [Sporothrix schenckii 1099-18]KJR83736.1 splicing factor 3B subunit 4 [Sporothrix schenckii 1099-18]
MAGRHWEQNKEATVYVGNLDERFVEPLMWEIMTQMGPVVNVHMPMDRVSRHHQGFGFVEFDTPESADYASRCLNGIRLFGKPVRVNKASADRQRATDIGAELFVNNLDPQVDEKVLYDTFAQFGRLVAAPNVIRDQNNLSKGYGFVNFDSFEASDAARAAMHGQYLLSKQISVEYAYKKDGKGERHGDEAERKLAAEGKKHNVVPEIQPLPPAFLMNRPASGANATNGAAPGAAAGGGPTASAATSANATPLPINSHNNPNRVNGGAPPPPPPPQQQQQQVNGGGNYPSRGPGGGGYLPYLGQQQQQQPQQQQQQYPRQQYGGQGGGGYGGRGGPLPQHFGGVGGGGGGRGGPGLPVAPNGLPARPPPGGVGGGGPPAGGPGGYRNMPPPGFSTGANNVPVVPPPGQLGFPPAGNGMPPPPPGYARR